MANTIIGKQPVLEALKAEAAVEKIFVLHRTRPQSVEKIRSLARRKGVPVVEVDAGKLREIAQTDNTQGVVALVGTTAYVEPEDILVAAERKEEKPLILILDEIEDPQNLGALIRTAECAGVHGVIIPKHHAASMTGTVAKASAGAVSHIAIARVTNIVQTIEDLKKRGLWIVGSEAEAEKVYDEMDYTGPVGIVVGNEGKGIRRLVKEKCDFLVKIPMYGKIDSLNASVSGALLMYEAARARHRKPA